MRSLQPSEEPVNKIILACAVGALAIVLGGYFIVQSFRQSLADALSCVQSKDMPRKIDGCTQVIGELEGNRNSLIKIQSPDLPTAYLERGYGYFATGKYDEAGRDFNKAIKLKPGFAMAYNNLGALGLRTGDLQSADKSLSRAIDLDPKLSLAWNNRCAARMRMDKYPEAIEACTQAIKLDDKYSDNYLIRGDSYLGKASTTQDDSTRQQYYDDALSDIDVAIKISPTGAPGYNERCRVLLARKDYALAITSCETAVSLKPDFAPPYANRGLAVLGQGNTSAAITDFDTALRLDPKSTQIRGFRSQAYRDAGDFDRALEDVQVILAQSPNDPSALSESGISHFALGNFHAAAEAFTASLSQDDFVYAKIWRYLSRMRAGEDGESGLVQDATGLKDKNWPYPVIEFYLGRRDANSMKAAAANDDQRCEATFYLGEWNLLQHNASEAEALMQKAKDTCPKTFFESMFAQAELKRLPH
jgi:tetratricopeptide (TPR) repeat protein